MAIVAVGSFNPAIVHPTWLSKNQLIAESDAENALEKILVTPQLAAFTAGWLSVQVTLEQAIFSTVEEARELDLRNLAMSVFEMLPHTPVDALGINADRHFQVESEDAWHTIGDMFLPKDRWEPVFAGEEWVTRGEGKAVGMRTMTVEAWRPNLRDFVRVEVAPSIRIKPHGVYMGINSHHQLTEDEDRSTGFDAAATIADRWEDDRAYEKKVQSQIMKWAP